MAVRQLAAMAVLVLIAGCSRGLFSGPPEPAKAPVTVPASDQPISFSISPGSGTPGLTATATLRLREPQRIPRLDPDGSFLGWICFRECGGGGASTTVTFTPSPGGSGVYTAEFAVPVVLRRNEGAGRFEPVVAGEYQVHAACVTDQAGGCASRSEVSTTFRVTQGLGTVAWQQLLAGQASAIQRLGAMSKISRSPVPTSQRSVECVEGNLDPRYGQPAPRLLLTDDSGRQLPPVVFGKDGPLIGRHGYAGCEDVALDPTHPDSYYMLEARHAGGSEPGAYPWPTFTRDGGAIWAPVPAPEGYEARRSFVGFTVTADGVTAWFSRASLEERSFSGDQIRGSFTRDGGRSWVTVEPSCSTQPTTCLWLVRDKPPMLRSGLIRSVDGGNHYSWATLGSIPFSADQVYVLEGSGGKVLEALNGSPTFYWGFMPLLRSEDWGATWRWVDVPTPPGDWIDTPGTTLSLRLDPDAALILGKSDEAKPVRWYRLGRGSDEWAPAER